MYDAEVDRNRTSLDIHGRYEGGGVCQNCRDNTEGTNCDRCQGGFFRPYGKFRNETDACQRKLKSSNIIIIIIINIISTIIVIIIIIMTASLV